MPAPDVQYFLDCSAICGQIAGDTHFYFMEICPNTNEVLDSYESNKRDHIENYWKSLTDTGLYFEDKYIQWRGNNRRSSKMASYSGLESIPTVFSEIVNSATEFLSDSQIDHVDSSAINFLNEKMDFKRIKGVIKRSLMRTAYDFNDSTAESIASVSRQMFDHQEQNRISYQRSINELRNSITGEAEWSDHDIYSDLRRGKSQAESQRIIREKIEKDKKIIKRSVKFLNKLIGSDTTRIFLGGDVIRFEGQYAIYELSKQSSVMNSHGGFKAVSVYDKDHPDMMLCNLCIATPNVPLLDHVANIVMHIRAGEELEILKIGNARNVDPLAYDKEWLSPHLPTPSSHEIGELGFDLGRIHAGRPDREVRIEQFKPIITRMIYEDVIADFVPTILKVNRGIMRSPELFPLLTAS